MNNSLLLGQEIKNIDTGNTYKIIHVYSNGSGHTEWLLLLDQENIIREIETGNLYDSWELLSTKYKDI